jgi:hypothetical protein
LDHKVLRVIKVLPVHMDILVLKATPDLQDLKEN